jgi:hypothetical protein
MLGASDQVTRGIRAIVVQCPEQCVIQIARDALKPREPFAIHCERLAAGLSPEPEDGVSAFRVSRGSAKGEHAYEQKCRMETHSFMVR